MRNFSQYFEPFELFKVWGAVQGYNKTLYPSFQMRIYSRFSGFVLARKAAALIPFIVAQIFEQ
jgi:hypothetical protein